MPKFKLVEQHLYWWPVTVQVPDPGKPGEFEAQTFEMQFEALALDEVELIETARLRQRVDGNTIAAETMLLKRVCRNWRGVEADDGGDAPFAEFARALQQTFFRNGCYAAYTASLNGERARLGN